VIEGSEVIPELVSVVICAWNNWPDLEMTIESALNQSYRPLEVIVVDNCSTDGTPEEVSCSFGCSVRYIRQPNRGDAGAYNTGFGVARGEFVQFVDGDDVLAPNKIEKQVEVFRAGPQADIVYGDVRMFQTRAGVANWIDPSTKEESDIWCALISSHVGICALGTLWRRRIIEKVGPWDETLYVADLDYLLRAAWAGCRFAHCPGGPMGFARVRPGQMTADQSAIARGLEIVWEKALGYVAREPYRSLIAAELARQRFNRALSRDITKQEALATVKLARATSPETVPAFVYIAARAAIILPVNLLRTEWLRPIRQWILAKLTFDSPKSRALIVRQPSIPGPRS
jgi:glycosyltransferase involved in cell wall biosynthesis